MPTRTGDPVASRRLTGTVFGMLWLVAVAGLTLTPQPTSLMEPTIARLSVCIICGERGTADAILNLLLFAPLGLVLSDRGCKPLRVAAVGLMLSGSIELTQHYIPGRFSNLGDVVWNTTGAWVGAVAWSHRALWLPGRSADAARLRAFALAVPALVTLAFGGLMKPALPAEPYWGQWTPDLGFMGQYGGQVLQASLDSIPIPPSRFPATEHPRRLLSGDWTQDARVVKGPPPAALSPILNIYDGREREVTMLGAVGQELVYRERSWAAVFRFSEPALRVPGVMSVAATGDTVQLSVVRKGGERCISFAGSEICPAFTPGRAWALLVPDLPLSNPGRRTLDVAWMVGLLLPVGLWSERPRHVAMAGGVCAVLLGLAVAATRVAAPLWTEVMGGVLGLLAGHMIRIALRAKPGRIAVPWHRRGG